MTYSKEERVLRLINRKSIDYLPSQITFSDRTRYIEISEKLGLGSSEELDDYLENHLYMSLTLQDKPAFYRNDFKEIERLKKLGFCYPDWENKIVFDIWGIGIEVGSDGYYQRFHPLQGKPLKGIKKILPIGLKNIVFEQDIEKAVKEYTVPDAYMRENFSEIEKDLKEKSGKFLVFVSGYNGVYERCYSLMGFQEFMLGITLKPKVVEELLEKITEYKIKIAKKLVKLGVKIAHHGDDLGTQESTLFSKEIFKKYILPRIAKIFKVYKDASVPVIMHSCGCITEFIPDLIDIGLDVLEPVQPCMDLKYLKKEFGKDLIFWGGIDTQKILPYASPARVKEMVRETIRILGRGGGLIIAPSQEIMNDVPIENVIALLETIKEERQIGNVK